MGIYKAIKNPIVTSRGHIQPGQTVELSDEEASAIGVGEFLEPVRVAAEKPAKMVKGAEDKQAKPRATKAVGKKK